MLLGLAGGALALGLYVERLADTETNVCPICHRVIVPGGVHEDAETGLSTELGSALRERGISFTTEQGETSYLNVLVYRFQQRRGGNFSVERPASVGYHVHLIGPGGLKVYVFQETQQALSETLRLLDFPAARGEADHCGGVRREAVEKALDSMAQRARLAARTRAVR